MAELTIDQVKKAVYSWSIRFSEKVYDFEQLKLLSREHLEDLIDLGVTEKQFEAAAKTVRRKCRFFPQMADIMDAVYEYRANPPVSDSLRIADTSSEHDQTPEEKELSEKLSSLAVQAMNKEITADEAVDLMDELIEKQKTFKGRMEV